MHWIRKNQNSVCFVMGLLVMVVTIVPNLILGQDAIFTYHDQLDGELIAYILQAKHMWESGGVPEFMGGMPKTALIMPAPLFVLLFLGENYLAALTMMLLIGRVVGFAGMYLLVKKRTGYAFVALTAGVLYGLLPFLPVYGLAQFGIPLLSWCALQLREKRYVVWSCIYVVLYALGSSLVLVGFCVLGMGALWILWELTGGKKNRTGGKSIIWLMWGFGLLLGTYLIENIGLLAQMFGAGETGVSHKVEYALGSQPFWGTFVENLLYGGQHSEGYQSILVPVCLMVVILMLIVVCVDRKKAGETGVFVVLRKVFAEKTMLSMAFRTMILCLGCNILLSVVAALWNAELMVGLRRNMGALGAFQVDRVLWVTPCFWYLFAACAVAVVLELAKSLKATLRRVFAAGCCLMVALAVAVTGLNILLAGDIKSNIQKMRNPDYGLFSFGEYYALGVMEQVEDFLEEKTGLGQSEYRVVSLGIDPAAALYHGFYCLDGYSNNYDLEYKHAFRKVIEPELAKSEYLRQYYDDWGNRCYLFSAECPGYYTIEKNFFFFQNFEINTEALKDLGCDFLLSAAYIANAGEQGLGLMNEVPFETENSYYNIYVYEICD